MKKIKIALIWKVLIACVLGCFLGRIFPVPAIRIFTTFNYLFSQYIGFMVPLIVVGLVTSAICKMGTDAGKLLLFTIFLAYFSSVIAGVFSYGVSEPVSKFSVPLCATIHMPGSMMKITACAIAIMLMQGSTFSFPLMLQFIMLLSITAVAAPGVPSGVIMASLGVVASVLGFEVSSQALMITLYVVMDNFGTACNVTADGAIALIVDRLFKKA